MKVENHTAYRTADLQRFFLAGLKALGADTDKLIVVIYTRSGGCSGRAWLGSKVFGRIVQGRWIKMRLPRPVDGSLPLDLTLIAAQVFEHEVFHTLGVRHTDMDRALRHCDQPPPAWAAELSITVEDGQPPSHPSALSPCASLRVGTTPRDR